MDVTKPYKFIGLGAMDVTRPYEFIGFGDTHGPEPYKFIGFRWAVIPQTPVVPVHRRACRGTKRFHKLCRTPLSHKLPYVTQWGDKSGLISAGFQSGEPQNRPSGRPESRF